MANKDNSPVTIDQEPDEVVREHGQTIVHQVAVQTKRLPAERKTAKQIAAQSKLLQKVIAEVMQEDVHFGIIPGTNKPTLYKAGSEKLLSTFRIAVIPEVFDLSTEDCIKYRILAKGVHQTTGILLGVGVGECSTDEEKYKWRKAICEEEFIDTDDERRRYKYKQYYDQPVERVEQVRTEPADLANTVLKMAKKRAQVDLTLTATGASDMFTQDLDEDGALIPRNEQYKTPTRTSGPRASGTGKKATEGQVKLIGVKLDQSNRDIEDLREKYEVEDISDLTMDQVNDVLAWLQK